MYRELKSRIKAPSSQTEWLNEHQILIDHHIRCLCMLETDTSLKFLHVSSKWICQILVILISMARLALDQALMVENAYQAVVIISNIWCSQTQNYSKFGHWKMQKSCIKEKPITNSSLTDTDLRRYLCNRSIVFKT